MNRGSTVGSGRYGSPRSCFNEAPIHESGKFDWDAKQVNPDVALQ